MYLQHRGINLAVLIRAVTRFANQIDEEFFKKSIFRYSTTDSVERESKAQTTCHCGEKDYISFLVFLYVC
jgi:hypothetical protein